MHGAETTWRQTLPMMAGNPNPKRDRYAALNVRHQQDRIVALLNKCLDATPVGAFGHYEQTTSVTALRPQVADIALFLGVVVAPKMFALGFDDEDSPVLEADEKVGIEAVG